METHSRRGNPGRLQESGFDVDAGGAGRSGKAGGGCSAGEGAAGRGPGEAGTCEMEEGLAFHTKELECHSAGHGSSAKLLRTEQ